jgi:hypothetical protein
MGLISTASARGQFKKRVIGLFQQMAQPTLFLKSFFRTETTEALELSLEVERSGRPVAVDILRGTDGRITRSDKSTEKIYIPPYFDYAYNLQALDGYDRLVGESNEITTAQWMRLVEKTAREVGKNVDRINRKYELMAAQAFLTGIVQMKNGDNIDFKRKAASIVAYAADHGWDTAANPGKILEQGADFLVQVGLVSGGTEFNVIMGSEAWNAFRANETRQKEGDIKDQKFQDLISPVPFGNGAVLKGRFSYGNYNFRLWGYNGFYDDPDNSNATTPYMDSKKIIMLPDMQDFVFGYGGVPAMISVEGTRIPTQMQGEFVPYEYTDEAKASAFFGIRSAGMPILSFVDRVFTATVVGSGGQG